MAGMSATVAGRVVTSLMGVVQTKEGAAEAAPFDETGLLVA
jgi:hypothetical protein